MWMCSSVIRRAALHTKKNLMEELAKIDRVLEREAPGCSRETLLVLDATTGQNGLNQAPGNLPRPAASPALF